MELFSSAISISLSLPFFVEILDEEKRDFQFCFNFEGFLTFTLNDRSTEEEFKLNLERGIHRIATKGIGRSHSIYFEFEEFSFDRSNLCDVSPNCGNDGQN